MASYFTGFKDGKICATDDTPGEVTYKWRYHKDATTVRDLLNALQTKIKFQLSGNDLKGYNLMLTENQAPTMTVIEYLHHWKELKEDGTVVFNFAMFNKWWAWRQSQMELQGKIFANDPCDVAEAIMFYNDFLRHEKTF